MQKKIRNLSPADAAYIAGLIDGEGTVTLTRRHRNEHRQVVVSIASTERALLEFVKSATGVGKITRKRVVSTRHSPSFTYAVSNRQALALLGQIRGQLKSYKAQRADLLLADYVRLTPPNGHYSPEMTTRRAAFVKSLLSITPK